MQDSVNLKHSTRYPRVDFMRENLHSRVSQGKITGARADTNSRDGPLTSVIHRLFYKAQENSPQFVR